MTVPLWASADIRVQLRPKLGGRTWAEEDQTGLQRLQLHLRLEVVGLHGAEDLTHGHVELIQTGRPAPTRSIPEGQMFLLLRTALSLYSTHATKGFRTVPGREGRAACRR